jgi:hypothetical protein
MAERKGHRLQTFSFPNVLKFAPELAVEHFYMDVIDRVH